MSGDIFGYLSLEWGFYQWLVGKIRDAAKHPTTRGIAPKIKNYPAQNAKAGKPCPIHILLLICTFYTYLILTSLPKAHYVFQLWILNTY